MAQQCPECGAASEAAPWCASCGAWLGDAERAEPVTARRGGRAATVVAAAGAVAALVFLTGDRSEAPAGSAAVAPVEDAEVLPPTVPPATGPVGRQFAVEAVVVWQRRVEAAPGSTLASDGDVVSLVVAGEAVLAVDVVTGTDVAVPPTVAVDDLVFDVAGDSVVVDVRGTVLRGLVAGSVAWTVELGAPLATAPVRTGTSLVVALANGEVAALAPADGSERWRRDLGVQPTAVAGDGTVLLVGTADGRVLRLDPDGAPVTTARVGEGPVLGLAAGRTAVVLLAGRLVGLDVDGQGAADAA